MLSTLFSAQLNALSGDRDINGSAEKVRIQLMKRKPKFIEGSFGKTLKKLRIARGLTQNELASQVGVSQRMIVYYELESVHPPVAILPDLARTLNVSIEQLLGAKAIKDPTLFADKRIMRRIKLLQELPPKDQRAVSALINSLAKNKSSQK